MKLICEGQYNKNLQLKAILSFRGYRQTKKRRAEQLTRANVLLSFKSVQTHWQLWRKYVEDKRQRRLFTKEIDDYLTEKTVRQVFTSLRYYCEKRKLANMAAAKVTSMVNKRVQRDIMWKMMSKSSRKMLLKSKEAGLRGAKEHQLVQHCFGFWFHSFNVLRIKEASVARSHAALVKRSVVKTWLAQMQQLTEE